MRLLSLSQEHTEAGIKEVLGAHGGRLISDGRKGERGRVELFWNESCPLQEKKGDAQVKRLLVFCYRVVWSPQAFSTGGGWSRPQGRLSFQTDQEGPATGDPDPQLQGPRAGVLSHLSDSDLTHSSLSPCSLDSDLDISQVSILFIPSITVLT